MHGFFGVYERCDLSSGSRERIPIDPAILRQTLGGVGLGAWLLHRECPPGADPLSPEAPLIFCFSPLVGTGLTTSAKFAVVAKSPLTGLFCDALASSHFALSGKAMGVDALVFVGACAAPSEWVCGTLRPTPHWGQSAEAAGLALAQEGHVAAIGRAGERGVRYATLSAEGRHAGRGGLGAVMGAKRLKAVVVRGDQSASVAEPERVAALAASIRQRAAGDATAKYRELGTTGNLLTFDRLGVLPTRNFQASSFGGAEALAGESWKVDRDKGRSACAHCTIGCGHRFSFRPVRAGAGAGSTGRPKDPGTGRSAAIDAAAAEDLQTTRIEYESLFALGPLVGVDDADAVLAAAQCCDVLGLDTISAGNTLAFAMECAERGLLEGGPAFGDGPGLTLWLEKIASRDGLGDWMAEGTRALASRIGRGAIDFAPQVKGLELPGYEPRALQSMALGFAVGTRGADHNRSGAYEADFSESADRLRGDARSVRGAVESEDRAAIMDSLILCKFVRGALDDFFGESAALMEAVTGFQYDAAELGEVARRISLLRKGFNIREGWTPAQDTLPERFLGEPLASGPAAGTRLPRARLQSMIEGYNRARGYDNAGWIPEAAWRAAAGPLGLAALPSPPESD